MSSVYLWDTDDGFAGVVLIKKCKLSLSLQRFCALVGRSSAAGKECASVTSAYADTNSQRTMMAPRLPPGIRVRP